MSFGADPSADRIVGPPNAPTPFVRPALLATVDPTDQALIAALVWASIEPSGCLA